MCSLYFGASAWTCMLKETVRQAPTRLAVGRLDGQAALLFLVGPVELCRATSNRRPALCLRYGKTAGAQSQSIVHAVSWVPLKGSPPRRAHSRLLLTTVEAKAALIASFEIPIETLAGPSPST